jgi:hypothetical protein
VERVSEIAPPPIIAQFHAGRTGEVRRFDVGSSQSRKIEQNTNALEPRLQTACAVIRQT